jgi:uncharacterized membrane protein
MNASKSSSTSPLKASLRRLLRYFWNGIVIIAPVTLTILFLRWIFVHIDGLLHPYVQTPGLGIVLVLSVVLVVGWIGTFLFMRRMFDFIDEWMERTPGVNFIYSSIRDFFDAFVGRKRRFTHAVLVNVFAEDVWLVGFLTDRKLENLDLSGDYVSVYVPQAYNVAGQLFLVKRDRVRSIDHLLPQNVMKYAVSGGAMDIAVAKSR